MLRTTTYQDLPSYEIGFEQGIEKGIEKGLQKGIQEERKKTIYILKEVGLDDRVISEKLGISLDELKKVLSN